MKPHHYECTYKTSPCTNRELGTNIEVAALHFIETFNVPSNIQIFFFIIV